MDILEYHLLHVLPLPLGGHVTDTVHSQEGEVLRELDEVPGDLVVCGPNCPVLGDGPLKGFNPATSANGRDNAIGITRVVHQSVVVSLQYCVNPNGSLHREWVVELRVGCATFPSLHTLGDVKSTTDIGTVQVVSHWVPEADLSSSLSEQRVVLNPWCVLLEADTSLVFLDLTTDFYLTEGLSL